MALTIVNTSDALGPQARSVGALKAVFANITFDSSYPTGGEAIAATDIGLARIDGCVAAGQAAGSRLFQWDQTNKKLLVFTAVGTEAANASDQSTIVADFIFFGV